MLVKCNFLDKIHLCTVQGRFENSGVSWTEEMAEAIMNCIPEDHKLGSLFQRWCVQGSLERQMIEDNIILRRERFELFLSLKMALTRWEENQDTKGAPGFEPGWYGFTCDSNLDAALTKMVKTVNAIMDDIEQSSKQPTAAE